MRDQRLPSKIAPPIKCARIYVAKYILTAMPDFRLGSATRFTLPSRNCHPPRNFTDFFVFRLAKGVLSV